MECNAWIFIGVVTTLIIAIAKFIYSVGKLTQKVSDMNDTLNNGICAKVDEISTTVAGMHGVAPKVDDLVNRVATIEGTMERRRPEDIKNR